MHKQLVLTPAGRAYLPALCDAFREIAAATTRLRSDGAAVTLTVGVRAAFDFRRLHLGRFRASQPLVGVQISQPAALAELLEGKVDLVIARGVEHHPGYRCDRLGTVSEPSGVADYLVCPDGTVDCLEVAVFRTWLLAPRAAGVGAKARDDTDVRAFRAAPQVAEMGD